MKSHRMMKTDEVAEFLGLSPQTIRNQLSRGIFPVLPKKVGGALRWDEMDVLEYLIDLPPIKYGGGKK
jgi:predicted DNA-binding transcriptional regulator AlpA